MKRGFLSISLLICLGGCATAGFRPPEYSYRAEGATDSVAIDTANMVHVQYYLRGITDTFDRMIRQAEGLKLATELPIIGAGVFAPTWLALGKSTDGAIYAAGAGAAGGALSNYFGLRNREAAVAVARSAITCVNREYVSQMTTGRTLAGLLDSAKVISLAGTSDAHTMAQSLSGSPGSAAEIASAGDIAIGAADEIISKLKIKLAGMGAAPDYGTILKDLQAKQKLADAQSETVDSLQALSKSQKAIAKSMADYPVRIATCVAQFQ